MNRFRYLLSLSLLLLLTAFQPVLAQASATPSMDTVMEKNGKIYVVVAVLTVIFIGIILFLLRMERKISKLEKRSNPHS